MGFGPMCSAPVCALPWWLWGPPITPTPWFIAEKAWYTAGMVEGGLYEAGKVEGGLYNAGMAEGGVG